MNWIQLSGEPEGLGPQGRINMAGEIINMEPHENIILNVEVKVEVGENSEATVTIPPEVRLTERLVQYLHEALKARDLELKHWTITTPEQEKELENLPNVVMGKDQD